MANVGDVYKAQSGWVGGDDWYSWIEVHVSKIEATQITYTIIASNWSRYGHTNGHGVSATYWGNDGTANNQRQRLTNATMGTWGWTENQRLTMTRQRYYGITRTCTERHHFNFVNSGIGSYDAGASATVNFNVPARPYEAPYAPANVKVSGGGSTKPALTWQANYTDAKGARPWATIDIQRQIDGGAWGDAAIGLSWSTLSWTDSSAQPGHTYAYRIRACNRGINTASNDNNYWQYSEWITTSGVRMGQTITVYDSSGKKQTGLVTAYGSDGKAHSVKMTGYNSSGQAYDVG